MKEINFGAYPVYQDDDKLMFTCPEAAEHFMEMILNMSGAMLKDLSNLTGVSEDIIIYHYIDALGLNMMNESIKEVARRERKKET